MSPNGGGGVAGFSSMSTAVHRSQNKLLRSNSMFNLWVLCEAIVSLHKTCHHLQCLADQREFIRLFVCVSAEKGGGRRGWSVTVYE